jgi:hypothetical protein
MRAAKSVGAVLLGLVLLVVLAGTALVLGGAPLIAGAIQKYGSSSLGREIRIGGAFGIDWSRPIVIAAEDVHVANAVWAELETWLRATRPALRQERGRQRHRLQPQALGRAHPLPQ